jgi:hypothetical protein
MHKVMAFLLLASGITFAQRSTPVPVTYTATSTDVTLKNSSTQPILALRVTVKGVKAIDVYEHDFFFKNMQFDPGDTLAVGMDKQLDSSDIQTRPVTVVWCQFVDGTQWGDLAEGGKMLAQRDATRDLLTNLAATTDDQTFMDLLNNQLQGRPHNTMAAIVAYQLRDIATKSGVAASRTEVAERIGNASNRKVSQVTGTVRTGGQIK